MSEEEPTAEKTLTALLLQLTVAIRLRSSELKKQIWFESSQTNWFWLPCSLQPQARISFDPTYLMYVGQKSSSFIVQSGQSSIRRVLCAANYTYSSFRFIALYMRSTNSFTLALIADRIVVYSSIQNLSSASKFQLSVFCVDYTSLKSFIISRLRVFAAQLAAFVSSIILSVSFPSLPMNWSAICLNCFSSASSSF